MEKIGIIGFGSIGKIHLENYRRIKDVEVVAVCDIDKAELEVARAKYGIEKVYEDYRLMLDREDIDAVSVCLPNNLHAEATIYSLKAGKHVLCEKPPAITAKEVREMFDTAKKTGMVLMIGLTYRFLDKSKVAKKFADAGALGEIYYARCGYLRRSGIPGMGSWFTTKSEAGAGPLFDIGVHVLDLTFWLMGDFRSDIVRASTYAKFGPYGKRAGTWGKPVPGGPFDVEDMGVAFIKMRSGATVILEVSWAANIGGVVFNTILLGDRGGLDYDSMTLYTEENDTLVDKKLSYRNNNAYLDELTHFVHTIRTGEEPITRADEMVWLQATLEAALKSAEEKREIKVESVLP